MSAYGFDRAVREEMRRIGEGRRARARQDAADAARRRRRHYEALIILAAVAVFIIGWDHASRSINLDRPAEVSSQGHGTHVTTTLPSHPKVRAR